MSLTCKSVKIFNKFFSSFLREIKEVHESLRAAVKSSYHVVDKSSDEYCSFFCEHVMPHKEMLLRKEFEFPEAETCLVGQNLSLKNILEKGNDDQKRMVCSYLYILMLFAYISTLSENKDVVLEQSVTLLSHIQKGALDAYESERDDVIDDDLTKILDCIKEYGCTTRVKAETATATESNNAFPDPMGFFEKLNNSKIADIAKEISQDIDVSSLKADSPDEVLKNLFSSNSDGGNVLGNIIQKVSTTLNDKISNGELRHEDLLGEAMSMMNLFGGAGGGNKGGDMLSGLASNPFFSQMAKAMKGGKANIRNDVIRKASARDRLRKKLEERKQANE